MLVCGSTAQSSADWPVLSMWTQTRSLFSCNDTKMNRWNPAWGCVWGGQSDIPINRTLPTGGVVVGSYYSPHGGQELFPWSVKANKTNWRLNFLFVCNSQRPANRNTDGIEMCFGQYDDQTSLSSHHVWMWGNNRRTEHGCGTCLTNRQTTSTWTISLILASWVMKHKQKVAVLSKKKIEKHLGWRNLGCNHLILTVKVLVTQWTAMWSSPNP